RVRSRVRTSASAWDRGRAVAALAGPSITRWSDGSVLIRGGRLLRLPGLALVVGHCWFLPSRVCTPQGLRVATGPKLIAPRDDQRRRAAPRAARSGGARQGRGTRRSPRSVRREGSAR